MGWWWGYVVTACSGGGGGVRSPTGLWRAGGDVRSGGLLAANMKVPTFRDK